MNRYRSHACLWIFVLRAGVIRGLVLPVLIAIFIIGCQRPDVIRDIRELPQDHCTYLCGDNPARPLVDFAWQEDMERRYLQNFFLPWRRETARFSAAEVESLWRKFTADAGGKNNQNRLCRRRLRRAIGNAGMRSYPNASLKGITVDAIDLRYLPMSLPASADAPGDAGNGLLLDRLQVSSVPPGTPVYISHFSQDRAWALVDTGFALGWSRKEGLADVSLDFMNLWERGPHAAVIRDKMPLHDPDGNFLYRAPLGSLFLLAAASSEALEIDIPVRGKGNKAEMRRVILRKGMAAKRPLPLTAGNLAVVANELLRDPYGWGGRRERRDCSSLIRDLYSPFGIWLPRHSADQAREGGNYIDLTGLSNDVKRQTIIAQGVPYLTLLWLKGHIMVYIGSRNGEPLVFHSFLSVRTTNGAGQSGKKIIGRASITTLYPGREFNGAADSEGPYLGPLRGMTLIGPPAAPRVIRQENGLKKERDSDNHQ